jgi:hypothetical protein
VQLGHVPVVQVLAAEHGVLEVDAPVVVGLDVAERRRDPSLGHHRVCLAEQRLADQRRAGPTLGRGDRRPQAGAARADHEHVVVVLLDLHQRIRGSSKAPIDASLM